MVVCRLKSPAEIWRRIPWVHKCDGGRRRDYAYKIDRTTSGEFLELPTCADKSGKKFLLKQCVVNQKQSEKSRIILFLTIPARKLSKLIKIYNKQSDSSSSTPLLQKSVVS